MLFVFRAKIVSAIAVFERQDAKLLESYAERQTRVAKFRIMTAAAETN